jgi:hypothetical protein
VSFGNKHARHNFGWLASARALETVMLEFKSLLFKERWPWVARGRGTRFLESKGLKWGSNHSVIDETPCKAELFIYIYIYTHSMYKYIYIEIDNYRYKYCNDPQNESTCVSLRIRCPIPSSL